ncbi:MAG: uroporphyrinogen-III C-methyltransferase [Fimbriiglobus sp.]
MLLSDEPRVFLVGAGPGDPGLMTVRAMELLTSADLVLFDQLIPKRLLDFAPAKSEKICVRDLPSQSPDKYPHIYEKMLTAARSGKRVVRLKGGDPLVFGRGAEEAEILRQSGVPYEIVPGVTAALAAAAYLEIPLTHRHQASAVAFVTGHELPMKPGGKLDWEALARFPGTLAIYMGIARLPLIIAELLKFGKDPNTPASIVERASTGDMRSTFSTLQNLEFARRQAGMESPGLIMIGEVIDLRAARSWFEHKPLFGHRVLVTRPRKQADKLLRRIEHLGGVPVYFPICDIEAVHDPELFQQALDQILAGAYDWLVFTSANGVQSFMNAFCRSHDLRALGKTRIAAIGQATAEAFEEYRARPDFVPTDSVRAEGFAQQLKPLVQGQKLLVVRGEQARETLPEMLSQVAEVQTLTVYTQTDTLNPEHDGIMAMRRGEVRFVLLSSSNIARGFLSILDETILGRIERAEVQLVVISPETGKVFEEARIPVAGVADPHTTEGMIQEMIRLSQKAVT